jgi:DNA-binding NarL/FixJ family response regulator
LTYRELAARAHYSPAVLSQAAAGKVVPPWPVVRAFVMACGADEAPWERRWHQVRRDQRLYKETGRPPPVSLASEVGLAPVPRVASPTSGHDDAEFDGISVFLLDDHELIRHALRVVLEAEPGMKVIGEANTVAEALAKIPELKPRVAILDVRLPDGDGVSVCRTVRSTMYTPPACLMLTSYSDDEALFGSIMAGAAGYMLKQVTGAAITAAVRTVAAGGSLLDAQLTEAVLGRLRNDWGQPDSRYQELSPQEQRVLELIADGLTNQEIAAQLFLAPKTVKNYVSALLHKLGFGRRTEAAVYASRRRIPTPDELATPGKSG